MSGLICCPRCGHHSPSRAKYCAQCGVNLGLAGAASPEWPRTRRPRRAWPVLVLFLVILAAVWFMGVALRVGSSGRAVFESYERPQGPHAVEHGDQDEDQHVITRESVWVIEH